MYKRCEAYKKAGADIIFPEAPLSPEDIKGDSEWSRRTGIPILLNGVRFGLSVKDATDMRYSILIIPGISFTVAPKAVYDVLMEFKKTGVYPDMVKAGKAFPFETIQELIRLPEVREWEEKFLPREERLERWGGEKVPGEYLQEIDYFKSVKGKK